MMSLTNKIKKILNLFKKIYHQKILKRKYYRIGSCVKCGCCCENIYVRHHNKLIKTQEEFEQIKCDDNYSFYKHISIIGQDDFGLIFACDRFDKEKRICTRHKKRPSICRNYPSEEIFSFGAQLQEGCGFSFEPIESFSEVYQKVCKKPVKVFDEFVEDGTWEEFEN